jgi:preprotein translocase SecE subunit
VARDRQRAKQRRKRQESAGSPARGTGARARAARDTGLQDASVEDAGLGYTPTPDPLKHASAEVDQAHLAEEGFAAPSPIEPFPDDEPLPDEVESAPDEVERDLVPVRQPAAGHDPDAEHHPVRQRGRVLSFLRHSVDELRRVQWPNRRQVGQATAVVLGFVVLAGGYLGLLDAIWKPIVDAIL